jgi:hypothetical protein
MEPKASISGTAMERCLIFGASSAARPLVLSEREATCLIGSSTLSATTAVRSFIRGGPGKASGQLGGALAHSLSVPTLVWLAPATKWPTSMLPAEAAVRMHRRIREVPSYPDWPSSPCRCRSAQSPLAPAFAPVRAGRLSASSVGRAGRLPAAGETPAYIDVSLYPRSVVRYHRAPRRAKKATHVQRCIVQLPNLRPL